MLVVRARLLARRRAISSPMLTSASLDTNFSSSIFASSSAIGCSKSRKFIAIVRRTPGGLRTIAVTTAREQGLAAGHVGSQPRSFHGDAGTRGADADNPILQ